MSTIPLAKGYNANKVEYPGYLSVKIDGTPIRADLSFDSGEVTTAYRTRQGKESFSCVPQWGIFISALIESGVCTAGAHTFVAEVTHPDFPDFKDSGGIVRRQEPQQGLVLNIFDYEPHGQDATFEERYTVLLYMLQHIHHKSFRAVPQMRVDNAEQFEKVRAALLERHPLCEGLVYRAASAKFKPASRHWDYQKILVKPTADLRIHSYEEAIDKDGNPKGMVGRINCDYGGKIIGVGPGKMKHGERLSEWQRWGARVQELYKDRIMQVEYKRDTSYNALREATFQCWRPDKDEPSYE